MAITPEVILQKYGLPLPLICIAEVVFNRLPLAEAKDFFARFPEAVREDGRDLSRVQWQFLGEMLRDLSPTTLQVEAVVDRVVAGMDLLAAGRKWQDATVASDVARHAAARWINDNAAAADARGQYWSRQRGRLLQLIAAA